MAVLGQNIAAMPEELAAFDNGSEAAARSNKDPALLELDRHSQTDIQDFATGAFQLLNQRDIHSRDWLSLSHREQEESIADMDSGEALSTFNIMQNPIMEELASRHATDALAFANDVMINLSHIELKQQLAQFVPTGFEDADDEDLTPDARRRKQAEQNMQNLAQAMSEIHEERMEEQMRLEKWNKDTHNFGGIQLSGEDLQKVMNFLKDPANRTKIEEKMRKDGVDEETIKKGREETDEYIRLKELQKKRDLTKAEQDKLKQIEQSEEFKIYAKKAAEEALTNGIKLPSMRVDVAQRFTAAATEESRIGNANEMQIEQAKNEASSFDSYKDSFRTKGSIKQTTETAKMEGNFSVSESSSMKGAWNVVDVKKAFQENNKPPETVVSTTPSNLELMKENKAELLEPSGTEVQKPPLQVALNTTAAAGMSF